MIVDIIILSFLSGRAMHGYEIKKHVGRILPGRTGLNNNLLYPALHRLEAMGAITKEIREQKGKPARHVYSATAVGREILHDMVGQLSESDAADDGEFLSRVAFFDLIEPSDKARILDMRARHLKRDLERRSALTKEYIDDFDSPWVLRVMNFENEKLKREMAWIDELRHHITPRRATRSSRR
jgi:DNA-binding PadR family transcriptional regulator